MNANILRATTWLFVTLAMLPALFADLVDEEFSGSGPYSVGGGPAGFDAPGWSLAGDPGIFYTNGLGETVYKANSFAGANPFDQDGLLRVVGNEAFSSKFEFSNAQLDSPATVVLGIADSSASASVQLVYQQSSSSAVADLAFFVGSSGTQWVGSASYSGVVQRATLYLKYRGELSDGSNLFEAFVEFNESGNLQLVGKISDLDYAVAATQFRTLFMTTAAYSGSNGASAEFDRFQLSGIPEPASSGLLLLAAACSCAQRRMRAHRIAG